MIVWSMRRSNVTKALSKVTQKIQLSKRTSDIHREFKSNYCSFLKTLRKFILRIYTRHGQAHGLQGESRLILANFQGFKGLVLNHD